MLYIPSLLSQNPQHTQKQLTAFSIHRLLTFVNAVNEDIVVGRFRVPAAGANTTNKTAQGEIGSLGTIMLAIS